MGSSPPVPPPAITPEFRAAFLREANHDGVMSFERFMALALYDARTGYYRRDQARVGYGPGTDFFTATSSGPLFGELVVAACVKLLGARNPGDYTFVEIGAEPAKSRGGQTRGGILAGVTHPFASARTCALGEEPALSGRTVVFSNELFDAQPFRRLVFRRSAWRELGVALSGNSLIEVELPITPGDSFLPATAPDDYRLDAPVAAAELAEKIVAQPWSGLFVACDYGKSWRELCEATPQGTGRAYFRHTQSNDLLARPGEQDLTCHVCWDWLEGALTRGGFRTTSTESQEGFFIRHAAELISQTSTAEAARLTQRKLALTQLLHPAHLGQKFQVLHAIRD